MCIQDSSSLGGGRAAWTGAGQRWASMGGSRQGSLLPAGQTLTGRASTHCSLHPDHFSRWEYTLWASKIIKGQISTLSACGCQSSASSQPTANSSLPRKEKFPHQHKPQPNLHAPHATQQSLRPSACATRTLLPQDPHLSLLQVKLSSSPGQEDTAQSLLSELNECHRVLSQ